MSQPVSLIFPHLKTLDELKDIVVDSRYKLVKRLGQGGQSEVFLAEDTGKKELSASKQGGKDQRVLQNENLHSKAHLRTDSTCS